MDGEVLHWDRSSDGSNVAELLFTEAGGRAAHTLGITLQGEEIFEHTNTNVDTRRFKYSM